MTIQRPVDKCCNTCRYFIRRKVGSFYGTCKNPDNYEITRDETDFCRGWKATEAHIEMQSNTRGW